MDIALVGGADTLSRMPVNGFSSLESLSTTLCEPFAVTAGGSLLAKRRH
ncbi:3-oxoacyl-(acyl carrier protein) synthase I [Leclercia adecarboxylata]|uniref:3-oxoacyl-(Acyl carrier protein) synthase I n=1 Tax=Leclercia adecarboxylata TaxID=83655 RepID=A0A4U9IX52_9ENTR|nr:3-oxoacyl-(acyl carrier protein) synthase I [Leclercia adecarboxylata]